MVVAVIMVNCNRTTPNMPCSQPQQARFARLRLLRRLAPRRRLKASVMRHGTPGRIRSATAAIGQELPLDARGPKRAPFSSAGCRFHTPVFDQF